MYLIHVGRAWCSCLAVLIFQLTLTNCCNKCVSRVLLGTNDDAIWRNTHYHYQDDKITGKMYWLFVFIIKGLRERCYWMACIFMKSTESRDMELNWWKLQWNMANKSESNLSAVTYQASSLRECLPSWVFKPFCHENMMVTYRLTSVWRQKWRNSIRHSMLS